MTAADRAADRAVARRIAALVKTRGRPPVLVASDGLPRVGPRQGIPAGFALIQATKPLTSLLVPVNGRPRSTGGTGGVTARPRDRRTGYDAYERTDLDSWELDLVFDGHGHSIERWARDLLAACSPVSYESTTGPPVLAIHAPAPFPSGLYRCATLADGDCEYGDDGLTRTVYETTLTVLPFRRGTSDAGLHVSTSAAHSAAKTQTSKKSVSSAAALKAARAKLPGKKR